MDVRACGGGGQSDGAFPSVRRTLQEAGNLTLARLESVDAGLYECVATNSVATVVTSTLLIIERTNIYNFSV